MLQRSFVESRTRPKSLFSFRNQTCWIVVFSFRNYSTIAATHLHICVWCSTLHFQRYIDFGNQRKYLLKGNKMLKMHAKIECGNLVFRNLFDLCYLYVVNVSQKYLRQKHSSFLLSKLHIYLTQNRSILNASEHGLPKDTNLFSKSLM